MPVSLGGRLSKGGRRDLVQCTQRGVLVVSDVQGSDLVAWHRRRVADQLLARAFGSRLDRQLAGGRSPDSSRLLAARAQDLVTMARREVLAADWEHLLEVARHAPAPSIGRMALCRDRIIAVTPEVLEMVTHLRAPLPVAARGVAAASVLLTDGAGPLYRMRAATGLRDAVLLATAYLDPSVPLFASPWETNLLHEVE